MSFRTVSFTALAALIAAGAGSARAADFGLPVSVPPPAFASNGVSWDGFYAGAHWGYGMGRTRWSDPGGYFAVAPSDVPAHGGSDGLLAGIQAGYAAQIGALVFGVEGHLSAGSLLGHAACGATVGVGGSGDVCTLRSDITGSLTGRFGFATGRALLYAKAGGAFSRDTARVANDVLIPVTAGSDTGVRYGWTVGTGVAYALDSRLSAFAEYDYARFNAHNSVYSAPAPSGVLRTQHDQHMVRFGLNYRLGGGGALAASAPAPEALGDVTGEFGTRAGLSSGKFRKKLYDNVTPGQLNSVLTWPSKNDVAVEAFAKAEHSSGLYLRGTIGGIDLGRGRMHDEDTAAAMAPFPYSNTVSTMKEGRDFYGSADIGFNFIKTDMVKLGALGGYGFYSQKVNGYGCEQVAGSVVCVPAGAVAASALTLSETERWSMFRLGLAGSLMLTDKLTISAEGLWLGHATLAAKDNHWLRTNINPLIESGRHGGRGYQFEAQLAYAVSPRWTVGGGVRYMALKTDGGVTFPGATAQSPEKFTSSRLTTFLQASYRFGDMASATLPVVTKY